MSPLDQYLQMVALKKRLAKQKQVEAAAKGGAPAEKEPTAPEASNLSKRGGK